MRDWLLRLHHPFRISPEAPPLSDPQTVRRLYERHRWSTFLSVTLGYGIFYVGRINFSVAKKPMLDEGILNATEMGMIGSALLIAYAVGKFANGFLADRSNIRRFMASGLLVIALVNAVLGFQPGFWAFLGLWALNGWFQSVGAPSSIVSLSRWFSPGERGTRYGVWCISHNLGEVVTFLVTSALVSAWGWRMGFFGPAAICAVGGLLLLRFLVDRPEAEGLPPVTVYRNDPAPTEREGQSVGAVQREVLTNPAVWVLGIASAMMYVSRYGVNHWGPLFLQESKGHSLMDSGTVMGIYSFAGLAGSFLSGIISDRFFQARRSLPCFLAGVTQVASLAALALIPPGHLWLDALALTVFGFAMGILVSFLGGLMAIDIVSPRAAGAASGLVGLLSYIGASIQDTVSGRLIDVGRVVQPDGSAVTDFGPTLAFWLGASLLSVLLPLTVWRQVEQARTGGRR